MDEGDVFAGFGDEDKEGSLVVGDLSDLGRVKAATVEQMPPTDFAVLPVLKGGKLVGLMENCYGVNKRADANTKKAGMFLLSLLLSDGMQSVSYMDNEDGIPLNRAVLEDYKETKMTTYL